ncbi:MAG TPA: hypothetical protein VJI12_04535 [archaeon]|nr:hypothetical protein [archaeon]
MEVRDEIKNFVSRRLRQEGGDADNLCTQERVLLYLIRGEYSPKTAASIDVEELYRTCRG